MGRTPDLTTVFGCDVNIKSIYEEEFFNKCVCSFLNSIIFRIQNQYLWSVILKLSQYGFDTAEFRCIIGLTAISRLLQRKISTFL